MSAEQNFNSPRAALAMFVGRSQLAAMQQMTRGEEGAHFKAKLDELTERLATMPKTYEQDGLGDQAVVYLHYFKGDMDWYITERDMEDPPIQCFGLADLGFGSPELGYINIEELIQNGVELDLYWEPKPLAEVRAEHEARLESESPAP